MSNYFDLKNTLEKLQEELLKFPPDGQDLDEDALSNQELAESKDLIITQESINGWHGTTILLKQILDPRTSVNIQHMDEIAVNEGDSFISYYIDVERQSRLEICASILKVLAHENIRRIICVPYFSGSYQLGIAAKNILGVPMVVWAMDVTFSVNSQLSSELFRLADIRFVISPEMRDFYEKEHPYKFYILPPTVKASWIGRFCQSDISQKLAEKTCLMIGGVWARSWMENLCQVIKKSGWTVHWYSSTYANPWLSTEELATYGIIRKSFLPQEELAALAASYPFAIAPTGLGDEADERRELTFYSLPSRIPFLVATTHIPILVVGNGESCAAKFVRRFGFGLTVGYEEQGFLAALEKLSDRKFLAQCSQNAVANVHLFSDEGLEAWIWNSCEKRTVVDDRFEKPFRKERGNLTPYREEAVPKEVSEHFTPVYASLRRLAQLGYQPDFVLDVGASSGFWSVTVQRLFPQARFILIDPLANQYPRWFSFQYPQFEWIVAAASNKNGESTFQVSSDLFGSSLFYSENGSADKLIKVPLITLDTLLVEKALCGRGILKVDVQFAEHLVIEGARRLLERVDIIILELTLRSVPPGAKTFLEILHQMELLGFYYFDDVGEWRCPITGVLIQKDVLFINKKTTLKEDIYS